MSKVYSHEEIGNDEWGIIDETYTPTGALVIGGLSKEAAEFYCDIMQAIYDTVRRDIEKGYLKERTHEL